MSYARIKYFDIVLIAALLLYCPLVFSQGSNDYTKKRFTFHIEKLDTSASFDVFAVNPKVKTDEQSGYSWYSEGKVLETKGGFSGRLLDGRFVSYYGNKNLRERGMFVKGQKKGKWMKWHANGKINEVSRWKNGVKQGEYTLYNDEGHKMLNAHFKRDKLNGKMTTYDKDKVLLKMKYRNGQEVIPKIPKGKSNTSAPQKKKSPFFKSIFKKSEKSKENKEPIKKEKEKSPVKEKKKKPVSMSSIQ